MASRLETMNETERFATLLSVASIGMLHTLLPNHWLCFSLVGKANRWSMSKVLSISMFFFSLFFSFPFYFPTIPNLSPHQHKWPLLQGLQSLHSIHCIFSLPPHLAAFAGFLHVISTISVSLLLATVGRSIIPEEQFEILTPYLLMIIGFVYFVMHCSGKKGHSHERVGRFAAIMLVVLPALSPCAAVLPVFVVVAKESTPFILTSCLVFMFSTVAVMILLVGLSYIGVSCTSRFDFINKYEKLIVGAVLFALGFLTLIFHTHDHSHGYPHDTYTQDEFSHIHEDHGSWVSNFSLFNTKYISLSSSNWHFFNGKKKNQKSKIKAPILLLLLFFK